MRAIYLDYNATTPIAAEVQRAMLPFLTEHHGNPSSDHALGRICAEAIDRARGQVAALVGMEADEVVFTSGGTEANNFALKGAIFGRRDPRRNHLVISAFEHPAVLQPVRFLERQGLAEVSIVGCDRRGVVDPDAVEAALRPETLLVSVMLANNEIGTVQPIAEIARRLRGREVLLHTDAAQAVGKMPVRMADLGADLLSMAGHKFYAPKGVGALIVRRETPLEPLLHGAGHEGGRRAGTPNTPYLVALGAAAEMVSRELGPAQAEMRRLRDRLEAHLVAQVPGLVVHGQEAPRLPNTLSVSFPGVVGLELLRRVPELCASVGAACHSGTTILSETMAALGVDDATARGTVRLSLGHSSSEEQIDRAGVLLVAAWKALAGGAGS